VNPEEIDRLQSTAHRRMNIGCGAFPMAFWTNVDADPLTVAQIHAIVPPIPAKDSSLDEIYAGHFLEHLNRSEAREFLRECMRCLVPGGRLGLVVPDMREILKRWLAGTIDAMEYPINTWWPLSDLDSVCACFLYGTVMESQHHWAYDEITLRKITAEMGFVNFEPICRYTDPRVARGAWYQCGCSGYKPL
jgi:predicted SAM-dependent methyltransferase